MIDRERESKGNLYYQSDFITVFSLLKECHKGLWVHHFIIFCCIVLIYFNLIFSPLYFAIYFEQLLLNVSNQFPLEVYDYTHVLLCRQDLE